MKRVSQVEVEGRRMELSNLEKVLYPKVGFTKAQVINYYVKISPVLLDHLRDRPLTMKRYPDGVEAPFFYEKNCPSFRPEWMRTAPIRSKEHEKTIHYCLANDLPSLVWAINLADIELHTSLALHQNVQSPTMLVFDLDPGLPANITNCAQVAFWLKSELDAAGLKSLPKTSGSKGLQVYVPLNKPTDYDTTKTFAKEMAEKLERDHSQSVVSKMSKALRVGKVFVDWSQNDEHKTTICVYSLRAKDMPTVSTPVTWAEVRSALEKKDASKLLFTSDDVLRRVEKSGDLFEPILKLKQRVEAIAT